GDQRRLRRQPRLAPGGDAAEGGNVLPQPDRRPRHGRAGTRLPAGGAIADRRERPLSSTRRAGRGPAARAEPPPGRARRPAGRADTGPGGARPAGPAAAPRARPRTPPAGRRGPAAVAGGRVPSARESDSAPWCIPSTVPEQV